METPIIVLGNNNELIKKTRGRPKGSLNKVKKPSKNAKISKELEYIVEKEAYDHIADTVPVQNSIVDQIEKQFINKKLENAKPAEIMEYNNKKSSQLIETFSNDDSITKNKLKNEDYLNRVNIMKSNPPRKRELITSINDKNVMSRIKQSLFPNDKQDGIEMEDISKIANRKKERDALKEALIKRSLFGDGIELNEMPVKKISNKEKKQRNIRISETTPEITDNIGKGLKTSILEGAIKRKLVQNENNRKKDAIDALGNVLKSKITQNKYIKNKPYSQSEKEEANIILKRLGQERKRVQEILSNDVEISNKPQQIKTSSLFGKYNKSVPKLKNNSEDIDMRFFNKGITKKDKVGKVYKPKSRSTIKKR